MKTCISGNFQNKEYKLVSLGYNDPRGRAMGARIFTGEVNFVPAPEDARSWYNIEPGHYFAFEPHATRDGITYGPIQKLQYFKTEQERFVAIEKYLNSARKRAAKR